MTSNTPCPDSPAAQKIRATRCGAIVRGAGSGAAIENMAPVRSRRVEGPGAWRISKFSTNRADTMCIAARVSRANERRARIVGVLEDGERWDARYTGRATGEPRPPSGVDGIVLPE